MRKSNGYLIIGLSFGIIFNSQAMGLRAFVALPLDKEGKVVRLVFKHNQPLNVNQLITQAAYGISDKQTLFLGLPFRLTPKNQQGLGNISILYRHIIWQNDQLSGTSRLGLVGGVRVQTNVNNDIAIQTGFVFTHFKNRYEIDLDGLYQTGIGQHPDSGRYDISWQYRLFPAQYPEWGLSQELYGVLELNGRWHQGKKLTHQLTTGLQWIHQSWVFEGGIVRDLNNSHEWRYVLSTRFHF